MVVNRTSGQIEKGYELHTTPVFDGMISAYQKVYVSMSDHSLICLSDKGEDLKGLSEEEIQSYRKNAVILPVKAVNKKKKKK